MARLFGTDGVRGLANKDVTAELALDLAVAAAHVLGESAKSADRRLTAIVGRDPRASGEFLSAAVTAGLASAGADVLDVGIMPTPAVAHLVSAHGADLGVMLSASHNPMQDNGIKFFAAGGHKLPDAVEDAIEAQSGAEWQRPTGARVGRIRTLEEAGQEYVNHLVSTVTHRLDGLKVVVDCAQGAASAVGPWALREAGADVHVIHADPDGLNINDGAGSTHPQALQEAVVRLGADAGIAFDGDADRCLAVDQNGQLVDGDQIMGILSLFLLERQALVEDTLVTTVMSNLGLHKAMQAAGVRTVSTAVGDRYVLEEMRRSGFNLGGEQSGHILLTDHATTGDGTLTSLHLLSRLAQLGGTMSELAAVVTRYPQVLLNVPGVDKARAATDPELGAAVQDAERELGDSGRVLLRSSGTEPLVRVMVEAADQGHAEAIAQRLAGVVKARLSL